MGKKKIKQHGGEEVEKTTVAVAPPKSTSSKSKKIEECLIYVNASYNNTIISATDVSGNVLAWTSAGSLGFSGPKKATPFAASKAVAALVEKLKGFDPKVVKVIVKGIGSGRDSALRSLVNYGFNIVSIKDATPIPHNGPRPPKVRRV